MTLAIERLSNKHNMGHLIFMETILPTTYANAVLLREYYQDHDIDFEEDRDWRYYFIVRRHFLRKQKRIHGKWECHYCQTEIQEMQTRNKKYQKKGKRALTVDHVVPLDKGGLKLDTSNMVVCCSKCNNKKGAMSYEDFLNKKRKSELVLN